MSDQEEQRATAAGERHRSAKAATEFDADLDSEIPNYHLGRELGRGGMSVVYAATSETSGEQVAVKILYPYFTGNTDLVNRLRREIDVLRKVQHPNIVRYLDSGQRASSYYYVMEMLSGETLEELLATEKQIPEEKACEIMLAVARGLAEAHRHQVFHRDVKPGNIFMLRNGQIKLVDFGLAKDETDAFQTQLGLVIGTPLFLAPEQARGEGDVDGRADIYALGITLFQCLTGEIPFEDLSVPLILTKKTVEPIPSPKETNSELSDNVCDIVRGMCERDVDARYPDVETLIDDLNRHLKGQSALWSDETRKRRTVVVTPLQPTVSASVLTDPILKSVIVDSSDLTKTLHYPPDEVIFLEGDRSKDVYLLIEGEVELLKAGIRITVLNEAGTFFGEMSSLLGLPRSTTVRTRTATRLIRIDHETFENFLASFPSLNYRMAVMLAKRLQKTTDKYYHGKARYRQLKRHFNIIQGLITEREEER